MKVRENQNFLSLYFEPAKVEWAVGAVDPYALVDSWSRDSVRDKALGQVPTPKPIAEVMAKWVTAHRPQTVLDPAVGLGNLLHECWLKIPTAQFLGIDRDSASLQQSKQSAPRGTKLICGDYLRSEVSLVDGIIANPPYVKAHHLDFSEADWRYMEERFGTPLDRLTNLYALFLLKIWEDLALGGRAAVIIPAEFLNANFGVEIKERLLRQIRPAGIAVFCPSGNLFSSALTTSCLLFIEKGRPKTSPIHGVRVTTVKQVRDFVSELLRGAKQSASGVSYLDFSKKAPSEKWLNTLLDRNPQEEPADFTHCVGDYFDCRRGIATGANDFFCLRRSDLAGARLNRHHVDPCITKAVDAQGLVFTREKFDTLASADRRCFLLNPKRNGPEVEAYLEAGKQLGIPARHLPSHRPVWYLPENREPAEIWVAVFSRESVKYIRNSAQAKNLTCFHGLYAKEPTWNLAPLMTVFLNSSWAKNSFKQVNRFYGDGLNKLEPKDVEAMPCPEMAVMTRREAEALEQQLRELELLSERRRQKEIDSLTSLHLSLAPR